VSESVFDQALSKRPGSPIIVEWEGTVEDQAVVLAGEERFHFAAQLGIGLLEVLKPGSNRSNASSGRFTPSTFGVKHRF